jgi:predicted DNA-binding transcriptional regulator AlpA
VNILGPRGHADQLPNSYTAAHTTHRATRIEENKNLRAAISEFPMRVNITAHAVGWIEYEVQGWLAERITKNNPLRTHSGGA